MSITTELGFDTPIRVSTIDNNDKIDSAILERLQHRKIAQLRLARIKLLKSKYSGNWVGGLRK